MAGRKYELDFLTGKTREEFLRNGAKAGGFREGRKKVKFDPSMFQFVQTIMHFNGKLHDRVFQ